MIDPEIRGLLERGVSALERLSEDPVIQMQVGPPVCPHCDKMNPMVQVKESEAEGPLGEFVIRATCMTCMNEFFALPAQWECARTKDQASQILMERLEINALNSRED